MTRTVHIGLVLSVLGVFAASASATLCDKCKQLPFTEDTKQCSRCDRMTASGQFAICPTCSAAAQQCERCLASLVVAPIAAAATQPTAKPADEMPAPPILAKFEPGKAGTYEYSKWKYVLTATRRQTNAELRSGRLYYDGKELTAQNAGDYYCTPWGKIGWWGRRTPEAQAVGGFDGWVHPSEQTPLTKRLVLPEAARRAEAIKKNLAQFTMMLQYMPPAGREGSEDKPHYNLTVTVPTIATFRYDPFWEIIQVKPAAAAKIVDYLAAEGYLQEAMDISNKRLRRPEGPTYILQLSCGSQQVGELWENLGWDLAMYRRLEGLRAVLPEAGVKALNTLLARLDEYKPQWEKKSIAGERGATQPAVQPGGQGRQDLD